MTTHTYIKDTIRLANSIVFKFEHINIYINYNILKNYGIDTVSQDQSKYYLNMNGLPFETDSDLLTYIPDIDDTGILTKDNINDYPILKEDLLNKGVIYKKLISQYRRENMLIKGIIKPIDITTSINAIDGTILQYDESLVATNEDSLIYEIEKFIKIYIGSYYNKKYNIDDYHIPGLLTNIYNNLPIQILKIRMSKINTMEVCDFHLYNYFRSYKYMTEEDMSFISKESIIWLYGNLKHLSKHIGHNSTLNSIINNIFDKSNIGIASLHLESGLPKVITDINNKNSSLYTKDKLLISKKSNTSYKGINEKYTLSDVLDLKAISNDISQDDYDLIYDNDKEVMDKINNDVDTKIYMFDKVDVKVLYNTTMFNTIFNNLIYYLKQSNFNINVVFLNPIDNGYLELDKHGIFYILLYSMSILQGKDISSVYITDYKIEGVLNNNIDITNLIKNTILKDKLIPIINDIFDIANDSSIPIDEITFGKRIKDIHTIYSKIWYYITNTNDITTSSDLKIVFDNFIQSHTISEDNTVSLRSLIDTYVSSDFTIHPSKASYMISKLCLDIFNLDVNTYSDIEDSFSKYIKFIDKFKSYSVQFLHDTKYLNSIFNYNNSILIGQQQRTIGNIYSAYFRRNNNINVVLSNINISNIDEMIFVNDSLNTYEIRHTDTITLLGYVDTIIEGNTVNIITNNINYD